MACRRKSGKKSQMAGRRGSIQLSGSKNEKKKRRRKVFVADDDDEDDVAAKRSSNEYSPG